MVVVANQHERLGTDDASYAHLLYQGEDYGSDGQVMYLRPRYYSPDTGRFSKVDPFAGNYEEPQSLHKYAYVHGDPINGIDPSGQFLALLGVGAFRLARGAGTVSRGAVIAAGIIDLTIAYTFRQLSLLSYGPGFVPVNKSILNSHYHSVRIKNSGKSADEIFTKLTKFKELDFYAVTALQNPTGVGSRVEFDVWGYGDLLQMDFPVEVTKFDRANRYFVVRTLGGHPLAGWRRWQVSQVGNDILIETFSAEHGATLVERWTKDHSWTHRIGMYATWTSMLHDLVSFSGGSIVEGSDTVINGENRTDRVGQYLPLMK